MSQGLEQLITESKLFITDPEQICDIVQAADRLFLYDTAAISSHENVFHHKKELWLKHFTKDEHPILITDTVAKEMCLLEEETKRRYLSYLSQFPNLVYIKEDNFFNLLEVEYETNKARPKFLLESEKAFSNFQPLKEIITDVKKNDFHRAEIRVLDAYHNFFHQHQNVNKGEISLLWLSCILGVIYPKSKINFLGIDSDLYTYISRCYFNNSYNYKEKSQRDIMISSNDTLIQAIHAMQVSLPHLDLEHYIDLYRDPERNVIFFEKTDGIKSHQVKREKFSNKQIKDLISLNQIEIVY